MRRIAALLLLSTAALADGSAERGAALFESIACYTCHGYNGTGLVPLTPETSGVLQNEATFITYLRLRGEKTQLVPSRRMPVYREDVLSDDDARDLYAYIATFADDAPAVEDIQPLDELLDDAKRRARESGRDD